MGPRRGSQDSLRSRAKVYQHQKTINKLITSIASGSPLFDGRRLVAYTANVSISYSDMLGTLHLSGAVTTLLTFFKSGAMKATLLTLYL